MVSFQLRRHIILVDEEDRDLLDEKWNISNGYAVRSVNPKMMHRIILERKIERPLLKDELCDHIDGNRCNNSRSNLRVATHIENMWNKGVGSSTTSGYKGVNCLHIGRKWSAGITVNGKRIKLGMFTDIHEAARAYNEAALKYYGEFARLNTVPSQTGPTEEFKALSEAQKDALTYMQSGGFSVHVNRADVLKLADTIVEMGFATKQISPRDQNYIHYTATAAGRYAVDMRHR